MSGAGTRDGFLDKRIAAEQPARGFRAGHDTVFLAAAVPAHSGQHALELGAGAGVASLCLAARVPGVAIAGVEIDPALVALANRNAAYNAMADRLRFICADAARYDPGAYFDHVFFNPPFHPASGQASPVPARDRAMRDTDDALIVWTARALALARPGGTVTAILRADGFDAWAARVPFALAMRPLVPRDGATPKRVVARIEAGVPGPATRLAPLALHRADGAPTDEAEEVLRRAGALAMAAPRA